MHPHFLYNDRIVSCSEPTLLPGQLGLLSGWGVFTTLRIYEGVPFAFERHWQRMRRDAEKIHIPFEIEQDATRAHLLDLIEQNAAQESSMRVCVVRSQGGFWEGPGYGNKADLIAFTNDLSQWRDSVSLSVAEQGRHAASPFAGTKTLSWAHNLTMAETAQQQGYAEVILLNERGEVAECTSANIFAAKQGITYTPPLSSGPLPGVTRAVMLSELNLPDAPVQEQVLRLEDLYEADEVFITSSTRELLPVHAILGRQIHQGPTWPVRDKLEAALTAYIRQYVQQAKENLQPSARAV
jgi:branched-chain amino acid aminotransferase